MAINIADNFSYKGKKPLDARIKYDNIASMVATSSNDLYDGCFAYVTETKKNYQYDSSNTEDATLGKWREFKGGVSDFDELTNRPQKEVTSIDSIIDPIPLPEHAQLGSVGFTPCGTIIAYYGETAPRNYLACDGSEYNKTDYPELWAHLSSLTDTTPYEVDGDNTKFKVPDLRGEFLRGTGTNGHSNQGNGANVGVHQDASIIPVVNLGGTTRTAPYSTTTFPSGYSDFASDSAGGEVKTKKASDANTIESAGTWVFTRPTNTSVLYCIAYKNIYIDAHVETTRKYSTEEQVIGEWIDGKPIYEKVFNFTSSSALNTYVVVGTIPNGTFISVQMLYMRYSSTIKLVPSDNYFRAEVSGTTLTIKHGVASDGSTCGKQGCCLVRYTKTID